MAKSSRFGFLRDLARKAVSGRIDDQSSVYRLEPTVRIGRHSRKAAAAYQRYSRAVSQALGTEVAASYTELVVLAVEHDGELGRLLACIVPDHAARVAPPHRDTYFRLLRAVVKERPEATSLVARTVPDLVGTMDRTALYEFVAHGLALYADSRDKAESFLKRESGAGQTEADRLIPGVGLDEVRRMLTLYARAHCGEDVDVKAAVGETRGSSDGRNVFLPKRVDTFGDERDFLTYKVMTAVNAGYIEFGTFDLRLDTVEGEYPPGRPGETDLERLYRGFMNKSLARDLFQVLEDLRVEKQLRETYPGIARDLDKLRETPEERPALDEMSKADQLVETLLRLSKGMDLEQASAGADPLVVAAADRLFPAMDAATSLEQDVHDVVRALPTFYQEADGLLRKVTEADYTQKDKIEQAMGMGHNKAMRSGEEGEGQEGEGSSGRDGGDQQGGGYGGLDGMENLDLDEEYEGLEPSASSGQLRPEDLAGDERAIEEEARRLAESLEEAGEQPSLAELRRDLRNREGRPQGTSYEEMAAWLERFNAPEGGLVDDSQGNEPMREMSETSTDGVRLKVRGPREHLYPEWDASISDYKPDWVRLVEYDVEPEGSTFNEDVRREYGPLIHALRRKFEALRPDAIRRERFLLDGDDIDIGAAIEARTVLKAGGIPDERLYATHRRARREVAVAFLVDLSSSTNEVANADGKRIIQVEKEALVCISEAVDAIGDRFAVFGFSGYGREHVAWYTAKDFDEKLDDRGRERIGGLTWKMENRDGAAIRHATKRLIQQPARIHLLILLSDGRPLDCGCDHYFDRYAYDDTRVALQEARQAGIHPFCITVDPRAEDYLEDMYGPGAYTIVDRVELLPQRLPQLYKRLTV